MFRKENYDEIRELFFKYPNKGFRIRELNKILGIAAKSLYVYLNYFEKMTLIKITNEYGLKIYRANLDSKQYKIEKSGYNLSQLYKSKIVDEINLKYDFPTIILFGSYAKGENNENSDIDIAIISKINVDLDISKYENILNHQIQILNIKDFSKLNKELKNNLINGKILSGYLEVFK